MPKPKKYNWKQLLPLICEEYINSDKSIKGILDELQGPTFATFYNNVWADKDLKDLWFMAQKAKAAALDDDFVEIGDLAREAFRNKDLNANALKIMLDATKVRRGQLDAKFNDRDQRITLEKGESWRLTQTKARQRLEEITIEGEIIGEET